MNIQTQSFNSSIQPVGIVRSYPRKREIVREDDPADQIYEVVSGTICTCKMLREGRRQIADFYSQETFSGWKAPNNTASPPRHHQR
jgi:CRP-like cAMP-binding protein